MRRFIKVLASAALIAIILAVGATSALAQRPDWAQPEDPPKYGWGANPELCKPYPAGCGYAYGKNK
jgi:hypothetical protein